MSRTDIIAEAVKTVEECLDRYGIDCDLAEFDNLVSDMALAVAHIEGEKI